ncbi:MAG: flagellar hook-associated protein FlgK [Phycisphaerae bacterium]
MAILGSNLQIGRSALATYQSALAVTGQNIANVANPDYARQTGRLTALEGGWTTAGLAPGAGVQLSQLVRNVDSALEDRLRHALAAREGASITQQTLLRTEALYNEFSDADLSTGLADFFAQFSALQVNPSDTAARDLILSTGQNLAAEFQRIRDGLIGQVEDLNATVEGTVRHADQITSEIAHLNGLIVQQEAQSQGTASALRDRRDGLLRDLAGYFDIQVRETQNGAVNVYVNSDPLVDGTRSRGLQAETEIVDGLEVFTVRFKDDNGLVRFKDGELAGMVEARDGAVRGQLDDLDTLAAGLIEAVNRVHSTGVGQVGYTNISGSNALLNTTTPLNDAASGAPIEVVNGALILHVRNKATGQETTHQIEIDLDGLNGNDTSLAGLANDLDEITGISASVTTDRRLQITAGAGQEFYFSEDTSGALAALGVGGFFDGTDAGSIRVNPALAANPKLIANSANGAAANGDKAGQIATLVAQAQNALGGRTVEEFHSDMFATVAVSAGNARVQFDAAEAVYESLQAQRESVSGVSLDEEAINLTKYQTAFQGAARYLSVVDQLTNDVISLVG